MRRRTAAFLLLALVPLCAGSFLTPAATAGPPKRSPSTPTVQWQDGLKVAHQQAMQQNKPILIVFGATWCGPCKTMKAETLAHPELAQHINDHFVPVYLDFDQNEKVANILEIESIPAVIVLSPNADLLGRYIGFAKPQKFFDNITEAERLHMQSQQVGRASIPNTVTRPTSAPTPTRSTAQPPVRSASQSSPRPYPTR
ncbi:MAG: thioredoxin family protein [Planctomycetaceae bacterium]